MARNQPNPQGAPVLHPRDRFSVGDRIKVVYQRSRHFGRTGRINRLGEKKHIFIDWDDDGDGEFCDFKHALLIESSVQRRERLMALERAQNQERQRTAPATDVYTGFLPHIPGPGQSTTAQPSYDSLSGSEHNNARTDNMVTREDSESQALLNHMAFVSASVISAHWEDEDAISSLTLDFERSLRLHIERQNNRRRSDT